MKTPGDSTPKNKTSEDDSPKDSDYYTASSAELIRRATDGAKGYTATISGDSPERLEDRMGSISIPITPFAPPEFLVLELSLRTADLSANNSVITGGGYPLTPSVSSASAYHTPMERAADAHLSGVDSEKTADS